MPTRNARGVATGVSISSHSHVFLSERHHNSERKTWAVIWLCGAMMICEIAGGILSGSIALIADGLHMSTHAGALLLAALAYTYARKHAHDPRFTFGTGKLGDLAGFTSAVILAMIALLIGYESVGRFFAPVPINFAEAIPIACLGLAVNVASAWLLSGEHDHHGHDHHGHQHHAKGHTHSGSNAGHHADEPHVISTPSGDFTLKIIEDSVPPRFQLSAQTGTLPKPGLCVIETIRPDGTRQTFALRERDGDLESVEEIPEPHAFEAHVRVGDHRHDCVFEEHGHQHPRGAASTHRDNNMRAAILHVIADAAVSVLVIGGLLLARAFGWVWMDPLAGIIGAGVIASWSWGLVRDTGAILLDMNPDQGLADQVRETIEGGGDALCDLHIWRLGPGHLGAIVAVRTHAQRDSSYYHARLARYRLLSHLTVEVEHA